MDRSGAARDLPLQSYFATNVQSKLVENSSTPISNLYSGFVHARKYDDRHQKPMSRCFCQGFRRLALLLGFLLPGTEQNKEEQGEAKKIILGHDGERAQRTLNVPI